jgi:3-oxoacyl-[acyl-carrier protein] reductase
MASQRDPGELSLFNKCAIVTGGSRGIGANIALEFARRGANIALVYCSDLSSDKAQDVATQVRSMKRRAVVIKVDLNDLDSGDRIVSAAREGLEVDRIDILVNNAGADAPPSQAIDFDPADFER